MDFNIESRIHRSMVQKKSHRFHSAEIYSHRFTQIVRVRSVSHRIHRIHRSIVQKKSHRFHRARRSLSLKHLCNSVKSVGVYLIRSFCEFGVFRGSISQQKVLCNSVKSVGVHLIISFCEFGVFCGSTSQQQTAWGRQGCRTLLCTMRVLCR